MVAWLSGATTTKVKGWLKPSTAESNPLRPLSENRGLARRRPRLINSEKGTRNFSDAASHRLYRTRAWFS